MITSDAEIRILVDNRVKEEFKSKLRAAWGLSILVNRELLFDTGPSPYVLEHNSKNLGSLEDLRSLKYVVLSHLHSDHIGGLRLIFQLFSKQAKDPVYLLPQSSSYDLLFPEDYFVINNYKSIEISEKYQLINFETDSGLKEQALIVNSRQGKIVIVGCMHMGLEALLEKLHGDIQLLIGGFHTRFLDQSIVQRYLELLASDSIRYVAPIHCSGEKFLKLCKEKLPEKCLDLAAGSTIEI